MDGLLEFFKTRKEIDGVDLHLSLEHNSNTRDISIFNHGDGRAKISYSSKEKYIIDFIQKLTLLRHIPIRKINMDSLTHPSASEPDYSNVIKILLKNLPGHLEELELGTETSILEFQEELIDAVTYSSSITSVETNFEDDPSAQFVHTRIQKLLNIPFDERPIRSKTKSAMKR